MVSLACLQMTLTPLCPVDGARLRTETLTLKLFALQMAATFHDMGQLEAQGSWCRFW